MHMTVTFMRKWTYLLIGAWLDSNHFTSLPMYDKSTLQESKDLVSDYLTPKAIRAEVSCNLS